MHLVTLAGHVLLVVPVNTSDRGRLLANGGATAIRHAAAEHDHAMITHTGKLGCVVLQAQLAIRVGDQVR
jgi:hypothetical protein